MEKPFRNFPDFFKNRNLNLLQGWPLLKSTFFTGKIIPESTRYVPNKLKIQNSIRVCVHLTRCNVCLRIHNDKQIAHTVTLRMSSKSDRINWVNVVHHLKPKKTKGGYTVDWLWSLFFQLYFLWRKIPFEMWKAVQI